MSHDPSPLQVPGTHPPGWTGVETPKGKAYFPALDGLRGLAIILVVSFHAFNGYYESGHGAVRALLLLPHLGWLGVPIFFCLSGFLVSLPFWEARQKKERWLPDGYAAKRIIRIVPSYYISIIFFVAIGSLFVGHSKDYVVTGLLWASGLGLYVGNPVYLDGPFWSLIVEMQFYLLLPILFWLGRGQLPFRTIVGIAIFLLALALGDRWLVILHAGPGMHAGEMEDRFKGGCAQMDLFVLGMIFAYLFYAENGLAVIRKIPYAVFPGVLILLLFLGQSFLRGRHPNESFSWPTYEIRHAVAAFGGFALILVQLYEKSFLYYVFTRKWLIYAGAISYEWYLFHDPIFEYAGTFAHRLHGSLSILMGGTIAPLLIGLLVSVGVHHGFYLPVSGFLRSRFLPKRAR